MREIKFRAWDKENKRWMTPSIEDGEESEVRLTLWGDIMFKLPWFEQKHGHTSIVDGNNSFNLMQYTGLKDKNSVEIYEGDVVNITQYFGGHPYGEKKHIIKRSKYNNNLVADSEGGNWRMPEVSMSFRKSDDYEVIGNVYENPELLKELEK